MLFVIERIFKNFLIYNFSYKFAFVPTKSVLVRKSRRTLEAHKPAFPSGGRGPAVVSHSESTVVDEVFEIHEKDSSSVSATFDSLEVGLPPSPTGEGYYTARQYTYKVYHTNLAT